MTALRLLFLAISPLILIGCVNNVQLVRPIFTCDINGQHYGAGEGGIPAPDGCNTCTCQSDGSLACTEIACVPAADSIGNEPAVDIADDIATPLADELPIVPDAPVIPSDTIPAVPEEHIIMRDGQSVGTAIFIIADDKTRVDITADLPELETGDAYHAWLVQIEPYDTWELDTLTWDEATAQFTLAFTSFEPLAQYAHLVITRGDATPADPFIDIIRNP